MDGKILHLTGSSLQLTQLGKVDDVTFPESEVPREENPLQTAVTKMSENYIDIITNHKSVQALVDYGAPFTIFSEICRQQLKKTKTADGGYTSLNQQTENWATSHTTEN